MREYLKKKKLLHNSETPSPNTQIYSSPIWWCAHLL